MGALKMKAPGIGRVEAGGLECACGAQARLRRTSPYGAMLYPPQADPDPILMRLRSINAPEAH